MDFQPMGKYIAIHPDKPTDESRGGIVLPERLQEPLPQGVVFAVGPEVSRPGVAIGDRVLYQKGAGIPIELDGCKFVVMVQEHIFGVVRPDESAASEVSIDGTQSPAEATVFDQLRAAIKGTGERVDVNITLRYPDGTEAGRSRGAIEDGAGTVSLDVPMETSPFDTCLSDALREMESAASDFENIPTEPTAESRSEPEKSLNVPVCHSW